MGSAMTAMIDIADSILLPGTGTALQGTPQAARSDNSLSFLDSSNQGTTPRMPAF